MGARPAAGCRTSGRALHPPASQCQHEDGSFLLQLSQAQGAGSAVPRVVSRWWPLPGLSFGDFGSCQGGVFSSWAAELEQSSYLGTWAQTCTKGKTLSQLQSRGFLCGHWVPSTVLGTVGRGDTRARLASRLPHLQDPHCPFHRQMLTPYCSSGPCGCSALLWSSRSLWSWTVVPAPHTVCPFSLCTAFPLFWNAFPSLPTTRPNCDSSCGSQLKCHSQGSLPSAGQVPGIGTQSPR